MGTQPVPSGSVLEGSISQAVPFHPPVLHNLLQKDEVYLNLVLDYVPETVYRVARHFTKAKQTIPVIYVKVSTKPILRWSVSSKMAGAVFSG